MTGTGELGWVEAVRRRWKAVSPARVVTMSLCAAVGHAVACLTVRVLYLHSLASEEGGAVILGFVSRALEFPLLTASKAYSDELNTLAWIANACLWGAVLGTLAAILTVRPDAEPDAEWR